MQRAVDFFGQFARNAFHAGDVVHPGGCHASHAAEPLQQAGALLGANARDVLELAATDAHLRASRESERGLMSASKSPVREPKSDPTDGDPEVPQLPMPGAIMVRGPWALSEGPGQISWDHLVDHTLQRGWGDRPVHLGNPLEGVTGGAIHQTRQVQAHRDTEVRVLTAALEVRGHRLYLPDPVAKTDLFLHIPPCELWEFHRSDPLATDVVRSHLSVDLDRGWHPSIGGNVCRCYPLIPA